MENAPQQTLKSDAGHFTALLSLYSPGVSCGRIDRRTLRNTFAVIETAGTSDLKQSYTHKKHKQGKEQKLSLAGQEELLLYCPAAGKPG